MSAPDDRLTDEQVARLCELVDDDEIVALAREVQEYRALRPPCPHGDTVVTQPGMGEMIHCHLLCELCPDGRMPLDVWIATLIDVIKGLYSFCPDGFAYAPADAVLTAAAREDTPPQRRQAPRIPSRNAKGIGQ